MVIVHEPFRAECSQAQGAKCNMNINSEEVFEMSLFHRAHGATVGVGALRTGIALLLAGMLSACGGGDEGDSNSATPLPPSPVGSVSVVDGFGAVRPDTATRVDLSAFVRGQGAVLTAMESTQAGCYASGLSGLTAEVTIDKGGLCQYTYTASNSASSAKASLNMLASSKASPVLPPLSQAVVLGGGDVTYDLPALLGGDWPSGYSLDPTSLQVQGGSVQGSASASGDSIIYTPPTTPDWNRIVFILKDPARPNEDALGTLYVTVSDAVNQAPVIGTPKYDYKAQTGTTVVTFEDAVLDLGSLVNLNISDPEGQDWQLVEVQSYSASVTPVDPNSVTNKQFTFSAGTLGTHIVSYIVGDHEGGFTMGMLNITVGPKERVKDWADITIGDLTFFAPPLYSEAASKSVTAEGVWDDGVNLNDTPPGNTIAGVTGLGASAYCNGKRLATKANLDTLRTTTAVDVERAKYPVLRNYLVPDASGVGYLTYNLSSGATETYIPGTTTNQYVICVKYADDGMMSYTPFPNTPLNGYTNTAISDGATWWQLGQVVSDGGVAGLALTASTNTGSGTLSEANFRLSPAGCVGTCTLEANAAAQEYGSASLSLTSASDSNTLAVGPVIFWQNAKLTALRAGVNNSAADGTSQNTVIATLRDKDGNPIPSGTEVKLTYSASAVVNFTPPSQAGGTPLTTDGNGEVTLALTTTTVGDVSVNIDPVVSGIPGNAVAATSTFVSAGPDFGAGCTQGLVTAGSLTYTCPLTQAQADANGISYSSTYTENGFVYVRHDFTSADAYCTGLGGYRLPTRTELEALFATYDNMESYAGWPTGSLYWSSTEGSPGTHYNVNLSSGVVNSALDSSNYFVTCVR